jgi:DNA-binding winged helix-turn-helix (wHTH) protein
MSESLIRLLLRLSEAGEPTILWGRQAKPYPDRDLEQLLARGVLTEQALADEWDVCSDCECGLVARPVQCIDGDLIAACPLDHARDARLDAHDLRSFSINAALIVDEIAAASGFAERPSEAMPGVWHLGRTPTKRSLFIALGRESVLAPGLIVALRTTEHKLPITLVGPAVAAAELRHFGEAGMHFVSTADAFATAGPAFALNLRNLAPPASIEPRLTLFRLQSKIIFEGRELELPPMSFQLLWLLAEQIERGNGIVERRRIEKHLWSTVVSKTATADAVRNLRDALKKGGMDSAQVDALVRNIPRQGYILELAASEIRLAD